MQKKRRVIRRKLFRYPASLPALPRPEPKYLTSLLNRVTRLDIHEAGSFNAGIAERGDGGLICIYRPSEYAFKACTLSPDFRVESYFPFGITNCADPRLLWVGDQLWTIYSSTEESIECIRGAVVMDQGHFVTDMQPFRVSPILTSRQKNWMPFMHEGKLMLVASVCPHIIYEFDLETRTSRQIHETPWLHPWFVQEHLRGSTNIVQLEDGNYLATFHTARRAGPQHTLHYDNGCYLFEGKPPFRVLRCSNRTYLPAEAAVEPHFRKAGVILVCFPVGMIRRGNELLISYGDNDSSVKIMTTTVDEMLATTVPVYPA